MLHILAKECRSSVIATADIYNTAAHRIVHLNNFALKNLFWLHFTDLRFLALLFLPLWSALQLLSA